jgi:hypothetical protein
MSPHILPPHFLLSVPKNDEVTYSTSKPGMEFWLWCLDDPDIRTNQSWIWVHAKINKLLTKPPFGKMCVMERCLAFEYSVPIYFSAL